MIWTDCFDNTPNDGGGGVRSVCVCVGTVSHHPIKFLPLDDGRKIGRRRFGERERERETRGKGGGGLGAFKSEVREMKEREEETENPQQAILYCCFVVSAATGREGGGGQFRSPITTVGNTYKTHFQTLVN